MAVSSCMQRREPDTLAGIGARVQAGCPVTHPAPASTWSAPPALHPACSWIPFSAQQRRSWACSPALLLRNEPQLGQLSSALSTTTVRPRRCWGAVRLHLSGLPVPLARQGFPAFCLLTSDFPVRA